MLPRSLEGLPDGWRQVAERRSGSVAGNDVEVPLATAEAVDRVAIYHAAIDLLAGIVAKAVMISGGQRGPLTGEELLEFETQRLRVYGYLAMHAPQSVMDANDALTDHVLEIVADGQHLDWPRFRALAVGLMNNIRDDVGIRPEPVS